MGNNLFVVGNLFQQSAMLIEVGCCGDESFYVALWLEKDKRIVEHLEVLYVYVMHCLLWESNAGRQLLPEAGAQRTL
jgi:hypothetical protein